MLNKIIEKILEKVCSPITKIKARCGEVTVILSNTSGLEQFVIAMRIGFCIALAVGILMIQKGQL